MPKCNPLWSTENPIKCRIRKVRKAVTLGAPTRCRIKRDWGSWSCRPIFARRTVATRNVGTTTTATVAGRWMCYAAITRQITSDIPEKVDEEDEARIAATNRETDQPSFTPLARAGNGGDPTLTDTPIAPIRAFGGRTAGAPAPKTAGRQLDFGRGANPAFDGCDDVASCGISRQTNFGAAVASPKVRFVPPARTAEYPCRGANTKE